MRKSLLVKALFTFLQAICYLLIAILFVLLTKDSWHLFGIGRTIVTISFFLMLFVGGWLCYRFGIYTYSNRSRYRIENVKYKGGQVNGQYR